MLQEEKIYIGIDVSKTKLDVFILPNKKYMQFTNDVCGIEKLLNKVQQLFSNALLVMEATGGYEAPLSHELSKANLKVCVVNPRQIRDFAKAAGRLAKTDKVDAEIIALFAMKLEPKPNIFYNEQQQKMVANNTRRRQLIDMIIAEKNRLDKASSEQKESIERVLEILEKELALIEQTQEQLLNQDESLVEKKNILHSIKGIGLITATAMLCELPELGTLTPKQIAALAGLAPFNRDSGTLKGKRTIWGGRASVRTALYMPTIVAIKYNPQIQVFYHRLCLAGKSKMTALIACMRKLLIIMNAMIRKKQCWIFEQMQLS
ncbi:MAG: IS110 family transposase [Legionella sp.]|nr:IS110 family transposase [Legionella sp.]